MPKPTVSIVTPVYNGARFLETTIQSVLGQQDGSLEYIIIDGGSTDGSVEIIQRYTDQLAYWVSEPDGGMYDAIDKGMQRATGDVMAWLNADDVYFPWTLRLVRELLATFPEVDWISSLQPVLFNEKGDPVAHFFYPGFSARLFWHGLYFPGKHPESPGFIQQEGTFWRRSLWDRAGGHMDTSYRLAGDFELWARYFNYAELIGIDAPLAAFRSHPQQLTAGQSDAYNSEALTVFQSHGGIKVGRWHKLARRWMKRPRRIAIRRGWIYRSRVIRYNFGIRQWKLVDAYF